MTKPVDTEAQVALDAWADKIADLEAEVAAGVAAYAAGLAADRRLAADDRRFAAAQADAIWRALRRARTKAPATKKTGRKSGKKL